MKNPHALAALELKLGIEAGVVECEEVIGWADGILNAEAYNDDMANISTARNASAKEIESLLGKMTVDVSEWDGLRPVLGRMHQCLVREPHRLHDFIKYLEKLWIRNGYETPADMHFIVGLEDAYLLAKDGVHGHVEDIHISLLDNLARFSPSDKVKG